MNKSFASDNHAGIHPALLEAMIDANQGHCPSYGQDPWSHKLKKLLKQEFGAVDSFLVFNGTAANVLSLQACLKSFESVLCTDVSHLNVDECGAPEKIVGSKLISVPSQNGKFNLDELESIIFRNGDQHFSQVRALSLTQPTEYGTLYTPDEIKRLRFFCDQHQLYLHMDGARLSNAVAALGCGWKEILKGIDILSFGGAKNGFLLGELVIVFKEGLEKDLKFYRKQSLQLPSKTRFLAAPFLKYFENNLWYEIASHENAMAKRLYEGLKALPQVQMTQPCQVNSVFCILPKEIIKPLKKKFFFYVWNENSFEVRLMTSFDTSKEDVDSFLEELNNLLK